ncbi:unnamed protein product, partial [Rangifer tarandus platyrhynchus]
HQAAWRDGLVQWPCDGHLISLDANLACTPDKSPVGTATSASCTGKSLSLKSGDFMYETPKGKVSQETVKL